MSGEKVKWTIDNTCKLIELYGEYPLLWNAEHSDYKNRYKKAYALKAMGNCLNVSIDEVARKLKNINSQYRRETRNYKLLKKSGEGKTFQSKWFGYELMSFLKDKNTPRKSEDAGGLLDTLRPPVDSCSQQESLAIECKEEDQSFIEEDFWNFENTNTSAKSTQTTPRMARTPADDAKKQPSHMVAVENSINKLQKNIENSKEDDDEFDYFGKSIAVQLRKMPLDRALICQEKLQAVMREERLYQFNSNLASTSQNKAQRSRFISADPLSSLPASPSGSNVSCSTNESSTSFLEASQITFNEAGKTRTFH